MHSESLILGRELFANCIFRFKTLLKLRKTRKLVMVSKPAYGGQGAGLYS